MTGWISLHRKIQDHEIFNEKRVYSRFEAWIYFLLNANHKEGKSVKNSNVITIKRGQLLTSKKKLIDVFGWSNTKLNRFLDVLELEQMIHTKSTSKYTLITIDNYDFYQSDEGRKNSKETSETFQKNIKSTSETFQKHTNNNDNNELIMKNNDNNDNNSVGGVDYHNQDFSIIVNEWQKLGFGLITERTTEQILDWLKDHDKDLIMHVIQYAHDNGAINQRYVHAVLKNAREKNVKTVADFEAEQEKRVASRKSSNGKSNNQVIQPKWFKEKKEEQPREKPRETKTDTDISNMINQFRKGNTP